MLAPKVFNPVDRKPKPSLFGGEVGSRSRRTVTLRERGEEARPDESMHSSRIADSKKKRKTKKLQKINKKAKYE